MSMEVVYEPKSTPETEEKSVENVDKPEEEPKPVENEEVKEPAPEEPTSKPEVTLDPLAEENTEKPNANLDEEAKNDIKEEPEKPEESKPDDVLAEIAHDAALITDAKNDIKRIDVFVCGTCHNVFHFIEEFQSHKDANCTEVSKLESACQNEAKPQVWGFTLWKNKQLKLLKEGETEPSAWSIYQNWCKLTSLEKEPWVVAGQTLQVCGKIGNAKLYEIKNEQRDPLAIEDGESANLSATELYKKALLKPVKLNNDVTILPSSKTGDTNKAFKILRESIRQECTVEKIVSKRFNPRRKTFEYQVKWENFDTSENTWEPPGNLTACKKMIEEFEEQLKKLKAEQKLNGRGRGRPRLSASTPKSYTPTNTSVSNVSSNELTPGRPQRASKQKALNQVKSWCGNISDADEGGIKRAYEDDDSDDSFEKKIKLEDYSDSEDEKPKYSLKKVPKSSVTTTTGQAVSILNNGLGSKLPQNVLIPDANGVVRINQKQLPSLSTGVYIMSKTAGIIKLDSTTSKVATSGGQTIVKVAPKIGQTHIKIVKKDGQTTNKIIQMSTPKVNIPGKTYKPVITKIKRNESDKTMKSNVKPKEDYVKPLVQIPPMDDDSDDGLPELEFPTDLPIPEPDSPPGDFVLDPETGKIVGQEYPEQDKPVVIHEQPSVESSLENIVKLAAADITEDDLKTEPTGLIASVALPNISSGDDLKTDINNLNSGSTVMETNDELQNDNSILNKALTNSNILQKTLVSPKPKPQPPQRILNHSIGQRSQSVNPLIRQTNQSLIRAKPAAPRPKFNIASTVTKVGDQGVRNVYSKTTTSPANNVAMRNKIGQTSVYRNTNPNINNKTPQSRLAHSGPNLNVYKASPRKEVMQSPSKPKAVINMPSLIGDDDQVMASTSTQAVATSVATETPVAPAETDLSSFSLADTDSPIYITGDDGTVYQVAGQNEQGQTILITQGTDGQQQCLLVTNEPTPEEAQAVEEADGVAEVEENKMDISEPLSVKTEEAQDQVVAQVVRTEPPSPGGTHKVVVMLPDGNLMVTQVSPEEYASLELE